MDSQTSSRTAYSRSWSGNTTNNHGKFQTQSTTAANSGGSRFRACFWNFSLFGLLRKKQQPPLLPIARFSDTKTRSAQHTHDHTHYGSSGNYAGSGEEKREFHDISFDLGHGHSDALEHRTTSKSRPAITLQELALPIQKLGGAKFPLTLPAAGTHDGAPSSSNSRIRTAPPLLRQGTSWHQAALEDPFIKMLPESCQKVSEKASPLGLVPKLLPPNIIGDKARYVGSSFWTWLCTVDGKYPCRYFYIFLGIYTRILTQIYHRLDRESHRRRMGARRSRLVPRLQRQLQRRNAIPRLLQRRHQSLHRPPHRHRNHHNRHS